MIYKNLKILALFLLTFIFFYFYLPSRSSHPPSLREYRVILNFGEVQEALYGDGFKSLTDIFFTENYVIGVKDGALNLGLHDQLYLMENRSGKTLLCSKTMNRCTDKKMSYCQIGKNRKEQFNCKRNY